ncbi:MAG: beta-Ala-His dipeptidase [Bacteriovoracaceae bacterium]
MTKPQNFPTQPKHLWDVFYDFTQTPRPSKGEEKIQKYLIDLANSKSLKWVKDKAGNIVIYVPGKNGRENDAPVLIQNHIDMVTDALPEVKIDFHNDPIETKVENGWLKAKGTTLGADNGIGCAAALAVVFDDSVIHPPLELLFTVDEETGLNGALGLETEHLKARKMLNLDTEEWGSLYIGCAGGIDYQFNKEFALEDARDKGALFELEIKGLVGGHSGLDIHEQRANAIKLVVEFLSESFQLEDIQLAELRGGRAHNIIPREAFCRFIAKETKAASLEKLAKDLKSGWTSFLPQEDHGLSVSFKKLEERASTCLSLADSKAFVHFAALFPHGVHAFDLASDKEIVGMSNNLARLLLVGGKGYAQTSLRFFDRNEAKRLEAQMRSLAEVFKFELESASEYPSWKPVLGNPVLEKVKAVYQETFHAEPEVTAIHAGLECGILRDKIGNIDVVSFGPTIMGAHSPDERVEIDTVEKFWLLFKNVLAKI